MLYTKKTIITRFRPVLIDANVTKLPAILATYGNQKYFFPDRDGYKEDDENIAFSDVVNFEYRKNNWGSSGVAFDIESWKKAYPFVLLDMSRVKDMSPTSGETLRLKITYKNANTVRTPHVGLLSKAKASIEKSGDRLVMKRSDD